MSTGMARKGDASFSVTCKRIAGSGVVVTTDSSATGMPASLSSYPQSMASVPSSILENSDFVYGKLERICP